MPGPDWLDGAARVESSAGGDLVGGPPRWVWHTYEADPARLSAVAGARALRAAGNDVHFVFNPLTGEIAQLLPASVSGRALRNLPGGVQTNRLGDVCLQVEVVGYARTPFTGILTAAGRTGLGRLVRFARAHRIPDVWPAGPPPAYPRGSSPRRVDIWMSRAGHYGHSQVPENDHGDPGAIDVATLWACAGEVAAPVVTTGGEGMDLYRDPSGRIWDIGSSGRRHVGHPETVKAYESRGGRVCSITEAGLASVPLVPGWLLSAQPPAPVVDVAALAAAIVERLPAVPGVPTAEQVAAVTVDLLAARARD
jgi:hypothetical protein